MKEHFNLKSLTFYGVMIGSVLVIFKTITAYGENYLKAPSSVAGNYRINARALPECFDQETLNLNLEQSGIYLFGNLSTNEQKIILDGKINGEQVFLSGKADRIAQCQITNKNPGIEIKGRAQEKTFIGAIRWNANPQGINFTGTLETLPTQSEPEH
ncbi:MAG: hypothetical protein IGR93_20595 [Hydrococcus sp. C42_A2020_068]|uniref:hypothetical protein n=1 Tax=Pleurocapsa sp. PCC 7327 TaxID=118163 RepID=UPI00029FC1C6|nr:hypothetical protein [Pleurocapsa sp. PCC 7327]AFY77028.1 hypothetical protein Ple7327_1665 [Pleurocapsa sp. PCC 7327]MBF2022422.1 hypothetical protein [Hydrococcus sp. C42_A2020_068]